MNMFIFFFLFEISKATEDLRRVIYIYGWDKMGKSKASKPVHVTIYFLSVQKQFNGRFLRGRHHMRFTKSGSFYHLRHQSQFKLRYDFLLTN